MRQKGGVDSPFRSPTRAFFVRFPSIPPRIPLPLSSRGCGSRGRAQRAAQCAQPTADVRAPLNARHAFPLS